MEEQGLAQQVGQQQQVGSPQGMSQEEMMQIVQQVANLLKQGVSPEELKAKGVPEEIIDMALQMVGMPDHDNDADNVGMPQAMDGLAARGVAG